MKLLHKTNKKGNFSFLGEQGVQLLVFVVILGTVGLTATMFNQTGGDIAFGWGNTSGCVPNEGGACVDSNATFVGVMDEGIDGIELFGDFTELIALVIIASIILGLLVFFKGDRR